MQTSGINIYNIRVNPGRDFIFARRFSREMKRVCHIDCSRFGAQPVYSLEPLPRPVRARRNLERAIKIKPLTSPSPALPYLIIGIN